VALLFHRTNPVRLFFKKSMAGIGVAALASMLGDETPAKTLPPEIGIPPEVMVPPKAKRIIYLFQSGGPAQQDLFDYKPMLNKMNGDELPPEVRGEQRLTGMSSNQSSLPLAGSQFKFSQHGQSGTWLSDLLPYHREIVDDVCFVKSMYTEAINHDPAITMFKTGSQIAGRPSLVQDLKQRGLLDDTLVIWGANLEEPPIRKAC
jgi:hypothetical protein